MDHWMDVALGATRMDAWIYTYLNIWISTDGAEKSIIYRRGRELSSPRSTTSRISSQPNSWIQFVIRSSKSLQGEDRVKQTPHGCRRTDTHTGARTHIACIHSASAQTRTQGTSQSRRIARGTAPPRATTPCHTSPCFLRATCSRRCARRAGRTVRERRRSCSDSRCRCSAPARASR